MEVRVDAFRLHAELLCVKWVVVELNLLRGVTLSSFSVSRQYDMILRQTPLSVCR